MCIMCFKQRSSHIFSVVSSRLSVVRIYALRFTFHCLLSTVCRPPSASGFFGAPSMAFAGASPGGTEVLSRETAPSSGSGNRGAPRRDTELEESPAEHASQDGRPAVDDQRPTAAPPPSPNGSIASHV